MQATPSELARQQAAVKRFDEAEDQRRRTEDAIWAKSHYSTLSRADVANKTFEHFITDEPGRLAAKAFIEKWTSADRWGLFLYGPPGSGKTHLLKALVIRETSPECKTAMFTVSEAMDMLRDDVNLGMEALLNAQILALDDLGAEKNTDWVREKLLTILEKRLHQGKHVFMTSNLTKEELVSKYDARVLDRLIEMMLFYHVDSPSYRKEIYTRNMAEAKN